MFTFTHRFLIPILLWLSLAWINDGIAQPANLALENLTPDNELASYWSTLNSQENALGSTNPQLIETLEAIADRLTILGEYREAYSLLGRAQQILRISEGLYTPSQHRLLEKRIENLAQLGDWRNARQLQEHSYWLYIHKNSTPNEATVTGLLHAADMHLRAVVEDHPEYQYYHYSYAATQSRVAARLAARLGLQNEPRYSQILYEQLKHNYLLARTTERASGVSGAPQDDGHSDSLVVSSETLRKFYRGKGYLFLDNLHQFFTERETPDTEAAAMVMLYLADWQVLFQQPELAVESYAEAYAALLDAGVSKALVDELFAQSSIIPEVEFYPRVADALASRMLPAQSVLPQLRNAQLRLSFDEQLARTASANNNRSEKLDDPAAAVFSFELSGIAESRGDGWRSWDQIRLGEILKLMPLWRANQTDAEQERLTEKLKWLRFRPSLVQGVPTAINGHISFSLSND